MQEASDLIATARESVSTVFRHILPGILIIAVGSLSVPSFFVRFDIGNTSSMVILAGIALAIGNAWYVFHRYAILQLIDFGAYFFKVKGKPSREGKSDYRSDVAKHVVRFFGALPTHKAMGRHIRDRFSSFNFMYIVSEAVIVFTFVSEGGSFLRERFPGALAIGILGFVAATWQYFIVRVIDAEFSNLYLQ